MFRKLRQLLSDTVLKVKNGISDTFEDGLKGALKKTGRAALAVGTGEIAAVGLARVTYSIENRLNGYTKSRINEEKEELRKKVWASLSRPNKYGGEVSIAEMAKNDPKLRDKINRTIDDFVDEIARRQQKPEVITALIKGEKVETDIIRESSYIRKNDNRLFDPPKRITKNLYRTDLYDALLNKISTETSSEVYKNLVNNLPLAAKGEKTGRLILTSDVAKYDHQPDKTISYDFSRKQFVISTYNKDNPYKIEREEYANTWDEVKSKLYKDNRAEDITQGDFDGILRRLKDHPKVLNNLSKLPSVKPSLASAVTKIKSIMKKEQQQTAALEQKQEQKQKKTKQKTTSIGLDM